MTTALPRKLKSLHLQAVMQGLYDSGIYCAVYDEWDAGWRVYLGRLMRPLALTLDEAAAWLHFNALRRHPRSTYASLGTAIENTRWVPAPDLTVVLSTLYECEERVHIQAVIGAGWNVGFQRQQTNVPCLRSAAEWLADQGRVRIPAQMMVSPTSAHTRW